MASNGSTRALNEIEAPLALRALKPGGGGTPDIGGDGAGARILIVDGLEMNRRMLRSMLKAAPYEIRECATASRAMEILQEDRIDLVVMPLVLPEISGPELCHWVKTNRKTQLIPVLMLTSVQGVQSEIAGISSGADEFLIQPVHPAVLRTRIRAMLRNKALIDSLEEAETILFALAQAVEYRDKCTALHCQRLAAYSVMLGEALRLSSSDLTALFRGGYLHDIGKICVPDQILFKTGQLTEEEWVIMRRHTVHGEQICKTMRSLAPVLPIIRNHHERWDGGGYPDKLQGTAIPLLARILQVADIYDALTTSRSYKTAMAPEEAFAVMQEEVRQGWRDPELVAQFIEMMRHRSGEADVIAMQASLSSMQFELSV